MDKQLFPLFDRTIMVENRLGLTCQEAVDLRREMGLPRSLYEFDGEQFLHYLARLESMLCSPHTRNPLQRRKAAKV